MDHKVSKDMISSGMIPSGEKTQADLGKTQYGSAPSPNKLMDAYMSMYEHHQKDKDGNTIPHEDEEVNEGKIPAGLQAYLDKKKGKKEDKKEVKEEVDKFNIVYNHFISEGYSEKEAYSKMANLTEEQLDEFVGAAMAGLKAVGGLMAKKGIGGALKTVGAKVGSKIGGSAGRKLGYKAGSAIANNPMTSYYMAKDLMPGGGGGGNPQPMMSKRTSTVSASADLFDIVKGQLIDEGLSEEEIKDIMLTLTPDEIMNEMAVNPNIAAMDAKNKADMIARAKAKEVPQNIRDASKRQMKAGTPREDPKNPYTTQDKKDIINYNKNK